MRELPYSNHFDAVINLGSSFGFFETETEDEAALEAVASALKPGGRFLLEMGNRDYLLKNFETTTSIQNPDGTITKVERSFDYMRSRINTRFQKFENGKPSDNWSHSWRAYTLAELTRLLDHAKLEFVSTFGNWRSETYDVNTSRMLVISKRRAAY
jgi:SAM-dependent methyltransferase